MEKLYRRITRFASQYAILTIATVGVAVYFNVLFNGFTGDDIGQIVNYAPVHSIGNFFRFFGRVSSINAYYRPVMYAAYSVIYSVFGQRAFPFHLFSLCIVVLNGVLVYWLFSKFFTKQIALISALFFIVIPINAEVAESIAAFQDIFFVLFGLGALLLSMRKQLPLKFLVGINLLILASLLSKETGVAFVMLIPVYAYLFNHAKSRNLTIASVLAFGEYLFFRIVIGHFIFSPPSPLIPISTIPLSQRLLSMPKIITHYLGAFFWPIHLATWQIWTVSQMTFKDFWLPLITVAICIALLCMWGRWTYRNDNQRFKTFLFFAIWLTIGIGIHLQIIPLDATVADRWFYLPSIGLIALLCIGIQQLSLKTDYKKIGSVLLVMAFLFCCVRVIIRNSNFRSDLVLFQHDTAINPSSNLLQNALGVELWQDGQYAAAQPHLLEAVKLEPKVSDYWFDLAGCYVTTDDIQKAQMAFLQAANLQPTTAFPAIDYASSLIAVRQYSSAIDYANNALQKYPQDPGLLLVLSAAYYDQGNITQAGNYLEQSYDIEPSTQVDYIYGRINALQPVPDGYLINSFLNIN